MGGVAHEWTGELPTDLVEGGEVRLRLVMTKFGPPSVRIGYELLLTTGP